MKFQPRRFVVEVKRGTSRATFASPDTVSSKFDSAERLLFASTPASASVQSNLAEAPSAKPTGRVLRSLVEPPAAVVDDVVERPRRGRKPGSKNKPKALPLAPAATGSDAILVAEARRTTERRGFAEDEPARSDAAVPAAPERDGRDAASDVRKGRQLRLRDRSSIIRRYVLGVAPTPGQPGSLRARRAARAG